MDHPAPSPALSLALASVSILCGACDRSSSSAPGSRSAEWEAPVELGTGSGSVAVARRDDGTTVVAWLGTQEIVSKSAGAGGSWGLPRPPARRRVAAASWA